MEANERAAAAVVMRVVQMGYKAVSDDGTVVIVVLTRFAAHRSQTLGIAQARRTTRRFNCIRAFRRCCRRLVSIAM